MRITTSLFVLSLFVLVFSISPALAANFPAFPMSFWGDVTINGSSAPAGTVIRAYYGTSLAGSVTVQEIGVYGYSAPTKQKLIIGEGAGTISIKVSSSGMNGGQEFGNESYPQFTSGEAVQKNLVFTFTSNPSPPSGGGGGGGGGGGSAPSATPQPSPMPTGSPIVLGLSTTVGDSLNLNKYGLKEGDTVSAVGSNDPDIYIVNEFGYKRLFLNPIIFEFYGHLGGWHVVKTVVSEARDAFPVSGIFRNCETNDPKVYAVQVIGEDAATLHWVNMTGAQAAAEDPEFFKKVFCINNKEFSWYPKSGEAYTSLAQVPVYSRQ